MNSKQILDVYRELTISMLNFKEMIIGNEPYFVDDEPYFVDDEPHFVDDEPYSVDDENWFVDDGFFNMNLLFVRIQSEFGKNDHQSDSYGSHYAMAPRKPRNFES